MSEQALVTRVAYALNINGYTCDGGNHEPGNYGECGDCTTICDRAARAALDAIPATSYYKCGAVWVNEPSEHTDPDYHGTHVCQLPAGHTDIRVPSDPMHMSIRGVTFRTSSTAREYTESEVATAVYRHFTRPSRDDIFAAIHNARCGCDGTTESDYENVLYGRETDAVVALFEQNGAEHE